MSNSDHQVPNLDRALTIIEWMNDRATGVSLSEIAKDLSFPQNSVYRIMMTLTARGYVERDEKTKRFYLGRKFLSICQSSIAERNLIELSIDIMRELRDETKESVLFGTLIGIEGVVLEQVPGTHNFRFVVEPGTRFPLHTAAPGKAIIADLPSHEADALIDRLPLKRFTGNTLTSKKAFREHMNGVREAGFGLDHAEEMEGQHCVAAAIRDTYQYPVAAIWITAPANRLPATDFEDWGRLVKAHADRISERLRRSVGNVA
ncbi:MAG: DNA-binding IclR family transcriptional regulator [Candidatus Omnitrophota bacterium]|jgi:DNA-binding IclR family transcriptional regulator